MNKEFLMSVISVPVNKGLEMNEDVNVLKSTVINLLEKEDGDSLIYMVIAIVWQYYMQNHYDKSVNQNLSTEEMFQFSLLVKNWQHITTDSAQDKKFQKLLAKIVPLLWV